MESERLTLTRAEGGGFEPPVGCPTMVFKTIALVRSAIPPPVILGCRSDNGRMAIATTITD